MTRVTYFLIGLFAFLLPLHGGISVFFPENFRWWKEILLMVLAVLFVLNLCLNRHFWHHFRSQVFPFNKSFLLMPWFWSLMFLVWGVLLVVFSQDLHTSAVAFRYLGFGFFAFVLWFFWCKTLMKSAKNEESFGDVFLHIFCTFFVFGVTVSVLFGGWAQFCGGFEIVSKFYASTISSWVPGQTLPLYHEAGGQIRMQGLSSGPIELAHLCLLGLVCLMGLRQKWPKWSLLCFGGVFLFGIYFTASRAVELVLLLVVLFLALKPFLFKYLSIESLLFILLGLSLFLGTAKWILTTEWAENNTWLNQEVGARGGTMDHFTRPVEAVKSGIKTPMFGQVGQWGPAARAKNLAVNNDDKAPIAENVFADWFVQLGILGLLLGISFLVALCRQFWIDQSFIGIGLISMFIIPLNLATIFDMSPISLSFFTFLALLMVRSDEILLVK